MAYEARRGSSTRSEEDMRNDKNNAKNIRAAADVASKSGEPHAAAIGKGIKAADKITGGKSTDALGRGLTNINNGMPRGGLSQGLSNNMAESGLSDKIGKGSNFEGRSGADTPNQVKNNKTVKGGEEDSLPSSSKRDNNVNPGSSQSSDDSDEKKSGKRKSQEDRSTSLAREKEESTDINETTSEKKGLFAFAIGKVTLALLLPLISVFVFILFLVIIVGAVVGVGDYEDAFGISQVTGEETGDVDFKASSKEQQDFYDRVNDVKNSYQANGKTVDALKIIAVYHTLNAHDAGLTYEDMTISTIEEIADCMFKDNYYSEDTFKANLVDSLFPRYLPRLSKSERESMADEVFEYIDRYYSIIGKDTSSNKNCGSSGTCSYDIKGFYIQGKGNINRSMQISDLKVRLMECGGSYGNGSYNKPIDQDLVNFEDYVAGVVYAEVGEVGALFSVETIKAQMVAARSFALGRPIDMGNQYGKKLEQENGQWILQISSCVADQVFCNINEGCSYMGGGDGQGGIVRSGKVPGAIRYRDPLPENSKLRQAAKETEGEVLVNAQGNIIYAGFLASDQYQWDRLEKSGLNYKQILLQHYNQGKRNYGAKSIEKANCGGVSGNCKASGEFAQWKQYEGEWVNVPMGDSGSTISQIGCLATSVAIQIARSGVETNIKGEFNPGTFVQFLNSHGGFADGGNFVWGAATTAAPTFKYVASISVAGKSKSEKLNIIKDLLKDPNVYVVAEVKDLNVGQHWVAIDSVDGDVVNMMDPGSASTDMWAEYGWQNTQSLVYYRVQK